MSQSGKCHRAANVTERQKSQSGKCHRAANVTGRQTSQGGKRHRAAKVLEWQMSWDGKCQERQLSQMAEGSTWQRVVFNGNCLTKAKVTEAKRALYLGAVLDGICHRKANGQWQMSPNGICLSWQMVDGIWDKEAKGRRQIGNGIRDSGIWNPSGSSDDQ